MNDVSLVKAKLRRWGATVEALAQRVLATAGLRHTESRISGDSQSYWYTSGDDKWKASSHWQDASVFAGSDLWSRIGRQHLDMVERGARTIGSTSSWRAYRTGLAEMTTYPIAAFWELAAACGLQPEAIQLVPKNELDERYAYFLLSKQGLGHDPTTTSA